MRVLVVEDHARLATTLATGLEEDGVACETEAGGQGACARICADPPDVVILDLGLPDLDGMEVIARVRAAGIGCPILVLTARDEVAARVAALDAGADDYVLKPFAYAELLARVRALARRAPVVAARRHDPRVALGPALIVSAGTRRVTLSPKEHALLGYLLGRADEVVSRAEVLRDVFGYAFDPGTNVIDVHLSHLRRKLAGFPLHIETVRGLGFRLEVR